jgi:hypothetical protein
MQKCKVFILILIGKSKDKNKDTFCLYDNFVQSNVECTVKPVNKGHLRACPFVFN